MDPNVDKAYHTAEQHMAIDTAGSGAAHGHTHKKSNSLTLAVDELTRGVSALSGKHTGSGGGIVTGTLANLLENFPQDLFFEPEDERQGVPLNSLPDEMMVLILRSLDHTTIERFAAVNRKARLISLDSAIWRDFVEMTYIPPQILHEMEMDVIAESYLSNYRRMYIEHPRLRLDGVYIAVCHYIRPGLGENAWVKINHLITYHRYLRFFPNGQVLSLLANEELGPQQVIPLLKPTLRMKGLFIGEWQLDDNTVYITNLLDASGKLSLPLLTSQSSPSAPMHYSSAIATTTSYSTRYAFQMTLTLRSRPLGRWNKLNFEAYDSVDLESGETIPLNLKHERAFWFSKVRSYTA
jgi:F-box protein 9